MTELAAPQISSLMEALPGIAAVLRSPVANAMVAVSRAAAGLEEFQLSHGEELLRFGVRRNLLTQEEVDKVLGELREVVAGRPAKPAPPPVDKAKKAVVPAAPVRALEIEKAPAPRPKPEPLVVKSSAKPVQAPVKHPVKPLAPKVVAKVAPAPKKAVATKPPAAKKAKPVKVAHSAAHAPHTGIHAAHSKKAAPHKVAKKPAGKKR